MEKSNIILSVVPKINVGDFTLEVGAVTETITVEADAGQLQIQTELGQRDAHIQVRLLLPARVERE